jgi:hypothetical protein
MKIRHMRRLANITVTKKSPCGAFKRPQVATPAWKLSILRALDFAHPVQIKTSG